MQLDIVQQVYNTVDSVTDRLKPNLDPRQITSQLSQAGYTPDRASRSSSLTVASGSDVLEYPSSASGETDSYVLFFINEYVYGGATIENPAPKTFGSQSQAGAVGALLNKGQEALVKTINSTNTGKGVMDKLGITENDKFAEFSPPKKRSKDVIALYMPHSFTSNYGAQYGDVDMDGILAAAVADFAESKSLSHAAESFGQNVAKETMKSIGGVVAGIMDPGKSQGWRNHLTKTVRNPRKETTFEAMYTREFSFNFLLTPNNEQESETIQKILKTFKKHMHPEVESSGGGLNMKFPNDFNIEFKHKDTNQDYVNKILTCVLTQMQVNYTPNNMWSTHADGAPTGIMLSLTFRELEPLHRAQIEAGY